MEEIRPDMETIKELSNQIISIDNKTEDIKEQLGQYKTSVSGFIHKMRRAETLLEFETDPYLLSLTETTKLRVRTMEDKIHKYNSDLVELTQQRSNLFEERRIIVEKLDNHLNHTVEYAYPFGTESPTIRLGKYYHITDQGDVVCEMIVESNSYFDKAFNRVI